MLVLGPVQRGDRCAALRSRIRRSPAYVLPAAPLSGHQEGAREAGWAARPTRGIVPRRRWFLYFVLPFACHLRYKGDKRRTRPWTVPCTPPREVEGQP
jgi:hypothetical protein